MIGNNEDWFYTVTTSCFHFVYFTIDKNDTVNLLSSQHSATRTTKAVLAKLWNSPHAERVSTSTDKRKLSKSRSDRLWTTLNDGVLKEA